MELSNPCKLCQKQESRYLCPRCNIPYCSLACYQSDTHTQCSESFYKDCVQEQISQDQLDPQSQKNMMEILQRVQQVDSQFSDEENNEIDSDDESDAEELAKRLAGVDLDDADQVWEHLTEEEKRQFEELLKSGDVSHVLPPWEPWWNQLEKCQLIEDLDTKPDEKNPSDLKLSRPKVKENIQSFSTLCKGTPSPCVRWNVVNVLASYALTARVYNGDLHSSAQEVAKTLVTLSDNLSSNQLFNSPETAVVAVHLAANSGSGVVEGCDENQLKDDVQKLVAGPSDKDQSLYTLAALSDVHCLFTNAKNTIKGESSQKQGEFSKKFLTRDQIVSKSDLNKHLKKLEYYLSWTKECF